MKLFIMRHSDRSDQQGVDEQYQSLTDAGRNKVINVTNSVIEFIAGTKINKVFTSPYRPAFETAEIVRKSIGPSTLIVSDALDPKNAGNLDQLIDLVKNTSNNEIVLIVGHNPQLENLIKHLTGDSVNLERGAIACIEISKFDGLGKLIWKNQSGESHPIKRRCLDWKDFWGWCFFIIAIICFSTGVWLFYQTIGIIKTGSGAGGIEISINGIGKVVGVDSKMILFLTSVAFIVTPLGFVGKALQEAIDKERGARDTIRHMSPWG